jgi:hypothetical protein
MVKRQMEKPLLALTVDDLLEDLARLQDEGCGHFRVRLALPDGRPIFSVAVDYDEKVVELGDVIDCEVDPDEL